MGRTDVAISNGSSEIEALQIFYPCNLFAFQIQYQFKYFFFSEKKNSIAALFQYCDT